MDKTGVFVDTAGVFMKKMITGIQTKKTTTTVTTIEQLLFDRFSDVCEPPSDGTVSGFDTGRKSVTGRIEGEILDSIAPMSN
ncbi:MAG: hypothetical protein ACOYLR_02210 [Chlorobium sp.]